MKATGLQAAAGAVAKLSPGGWAKLPFDIADKTLPVAVGYFSPWANGVTYHLAWSQETDGRFPYVSRVSKTAQPAAQFTYKQGRGFEVALDASATEPGDSEDLRFEWRVDGRRVGSGKRLTHDFGAVGAYRVDLVVTDGNGERNDFSSGVKVTVGRPPSVSIRDCAAVGEGRVGLSADFGDSDGDIDLIEWCPRADCGEGEWTDSEEVGFVDEVVLDGARGTHARVAAVDESGNRTESTCKVEGASIPTEPTEPPPEPTDPPREAGETFREPLRSGGLGPEMVVIPAGSFRMGCLKADGGPYDWDSPCDPQEHPVHVVNFAEPFAVSKYEVTFDDYERYLLAVRGEQALKALPDEGWGRGNRPVIYFSPADSKRYVAWLSSETGATYRLLSEAEWEYAARAGTETKYSWGDKVGTNQANCYGCRSQWDRDGEWRTAPVGSFAPNPWGLHDMHGNVWESVEDCWNYNYEGAPTDGSAWTSGDCDEFVLRGGSWKRKPWLSRSAYRSSLSDEENFIDYLDVGMRVARSLSGILCL